MSIDPVQGATLGADLNPLTTDMLRRPRASDSAPTPLPEESSTPKTTPQSLPEARTLQVSASFGQNHIVVYRIVDKTTGELVEQIPPERFIDLRNSVQEISKVESPNVPAELDVRS